MIFIETRAQAGKTPFIAAENSPAALFMGVQNNLCCLVFSIIEEKRWLPALE